jgi:hypothetical protein
VFFRNGFLFLSLYIFFWCLHERTTIARRTFSIEPDPHIEAIVAAKGMVLEGTSKWSAKIAVTGITQRWRMIFSVKGTLFYGHSG